MVAVLLLILCAACGDPDAAGGDPSEPASDSTSGDTVQTSPSGVEVSGSLDAKPEITIPDGDPPKELEVTDIIEGDGEEVAEGATVTAHYVGQSWSNGKQFDASWDTSGEPATFGLDQVIPGWTQGLPGMKVGGRRLLVIPSEMGYGAQGYPPDIAPNETLVFVVDMVATE
jgi:peptidylprolyl isomerase